MSLYEGIKTAIIYGAGKGGALTYEHLTQNGVEVAAFIDDFKTGEYFGKPIIKLEDIKNYEVDGYFVGTAREGYIVLTWAINVLSINKDAHIYVSLSIPALDKHGNKTKRLVRNIPPINPKQYLYLFEENDFIKDFDWYLDFIEYQEQFFSNRFYILSMNDISKLRKYMKDKRYQHSYPAINFDVEEGDIALDCGAGSSKENYINCDYFAIKAGAVGRVYAFEPIPSIYAELLEDVKDFKNIIPVNKGISDKKSVVYLKDTESTTISEQRLNTKVELTTIDDFVKDNGIEKVDFIKVIIEGLELDALKGAINTIKTFKPKITSSVWYKPEHFYEIPQFIKSLVPEYKIWLLNTKIIDMCGGWSGMQIFCRV